MKKKLIDFIDFEKVDVLLEGFNKTTGFVTAILDLDGNVLSKSGWRQICTEFHRVNPNSSKKCTISDTELAGKLAEGENYHFYKCLNGLVDVAVPIIIKGEHIANLFSGQFFFEKPDRDFFIKQASKYDFNTTAYLKSLDDVPVIAEEKVKPAMEFLLSMTQLITEMSMQRLEQIELNNTIKESEERFRAYVEQAADSLFVHDFNGKFIDVNQRACESLGYSREELLNLSVFDVEQDFDLQSAQELWSKIQPNQYSILIGNQRRKDGSIFPVEVSFGCYDKNRERYFIGQVRDITERKNLEKEIQQKNLNLTSLLDMSQKLAMIINPNAVLQEIIAAATELKNLDTGAIYLLKGENLYMGATTPPLPENFPEVFRHSKIKEHPHIQKSVTILKPVIVPDLAVAVLSPAEKIIQETRNLKSLIYIPLIIEQRVLGILILGTQKEIHSFSESEIDLYLTMSVQAAMAIYNSQLFEEVKTLNEELEQKVADRTVELSKSQKALLNLVEDLNEKSDEIEKSSKSLEAKNKELETFTYSVSHDLKAPLRGIDGYSQILLKEYESKLDAEGKRFLRTIRESAMQMNQLINDLLEYSRLERQTLRPSIFNIKNLIEILVVNKTSDKSFNNFKITINVPEIEIYLDKDGLNLALRNLIENAFKFTQKQINPKIEIGYQDNNSKHTIFVNDNGIGFDMKFHDRIFEIFQRLHRSEDYEGTGVGLAMVRKAIERLNGKVWAESEVGKGSAFYIEIPKIQSDDSNKL